MRVVITRPRKHFDSAAEALRARAVVPIYFPTIQITTVRESQDLEAALNRLDEIDWAVFTSANAVEAVWARLEQLGTTLPQKLRIAAVGPKTAEQLAARGRSPDFVPQTYIAEAILPGLGDLSGKKVFLPLADLAQDTLARAVDQAGGTPIQVTAYHTIPAKPDPNALQEIRNGVDAVAFTSGSTARNFAALVATAGLDPFDLPESPLIACIGPKTEAAARAAGFAVDVVAEEYTLEGLLDAIITAAQ